MALRILVIDDEPLLRSTLARILRPCEVETAASAIEALRLIEQGEIFDVILCDVMMPKMTGVELLQTRPELRDRFVLMSGSSVEQGAGERWPRLVKPFTAEELLRVIGAVSGRAVD